MNKVKTIVILFFLGLLMLAIYSCKKESESTSGVQNTGDILIDSLLVSTHSIKAHTDSSVISVRTTGDDYLISWEANHGTVIENGSVTIIFDSITHIPVVEGANVVYFAGECCVGTNIITCTVKDGNKIHSDTIQIHVNSYYD
ncbi:MAG: hypothetical protein JEZ03_16665 [Bacteroidales bacterium]|nr:hypothetical protein [Bacteroidales bacterium]